MDRLVLTDAQWAKMAPHCLSKPRDPRRRGKDNRLFAAALLCIARTGSPWRDLPPLFGHWNSVFTRFRDWVRADVFKRLFDAVSDEPDMEHAMADATTAKSRKSPCDFAATATDKARKGGFAPGHWPLQGRHDHQDPRAH